MKTCSKCKERKPKGEFYKDSKRKDGLKPWCKDCHNAANQAYNKSEDGRKYYAGHRAKNRDKIRANHTAWRKREYPRVRTAKWQQRGIDCTMEEYNQAFVDQKGCCGICLTPQSELRKALAVDHCHKTGRVRGLLCDVCNLGLGHFRDDASRLRRAARWVS